MTLLALGLGLGPGLPACRRAPRRDGAEEAGVALSAGPASAAAQPPPAGDARVGQPVLDAGSAVRVDASAADAGTPAAKPVKPVVGKRRPRRPRGRDDCDSWYCDNQGNCWPGRCP